MTKLTKRQEIALSVAAAVEGCSIAEFKRRCLADTADDLLTEPEIAEMVALVVQFRRQQAGGVITLEDHR